MSSLRNSRCQRLPRLTAAGVAVLAGLALAAAPQVVAPQEGAPQEADSGAVATELSAPPVVMVVEVSSIIHRVVTEYLTEALDEADRIQARALIIELSTPGGDLAATREIFSAMLGAETPVVVYVSPSGSQAASAGFFLLMAADVAAMAPETNTGAAHPVGPGGQDIPGAMGEKIEQDTAATIRFLAARNGRNQELAEATVIESRSFTAEEALELGLVDMVVPTIDRLIADLDGRELERNDDTRVVLRTRDATVVRREMHLFQRLLSILAYPDIALMLMTLGGLGLYVELSNPGAVFPGVFGAIFLILGLYGTSVLPVNYAGLALLGLAGILFFAELKVQSFGILTVAGIASLVLGSLMLFNSPDPALRVSRQLIAALSLLSLVVVASLSALVYRAHRGGIRTGRQGLSQELARARSEIGPNTPGKVDLHGEIWNAVSKETVREGQQVEVVGVDGLTVQVRPVVDESAQQEGNESWQE